MDPVVEVYWKAFGRDQTAGTRRCSIMAPINRALRSTTRRVKKRYPGHEIRIRLPQPVGSMQLQDHPAVVANLEMEAIPESSTCGKSTQAMPSRAFQASRLRSIQ